MNTEKPEKLFWDPYVGQRVRLYVQKDWRSTPLAAQDGREGIITSFTSEYLWVEWDGEPALSGHFYCEWSLHMSRYLLRPVENIDWSDTLELQ